MNLSIVYSQIPEIYRWLSFKNDFKLKTYNKLVKMHRKSQTREIKGVNPMKIKIKAAPFGYAFASELVFNASFSVN